MSSLQSFRGRKQEDLIKGDICVLLFRFTKTQRACRVFLEWLKKNGSEATPRELSRFATDLQAGRIDPGFTYRRETFYRIILRQLLEMGFIEKQTRYRGIVYAPVIQPIPLRAPLLKTWWGLSYMVAKKWNFEWQT